MILLESWGKTMENIMGFDGYLYYVVAYDDDGTKSVYEYGNLKHAVEHFQQEKDAYLIKLRASNF